MYQSIEFQSECVTLRGRFYKPEHVTENLPVIIMAHGYSATIEGMVADRFAEVFCKSGIAAVLYDHHSFGVSDGEPRQQVNKWIQARGFRDAVKYVNTLSEIDRSKIALWGDSMSGSEVIVVAAIDHRIEACIVQVPAMGAVLPPEDPDGTLFQKIKDTFVNGNVAATPETTLGPRPVVSFDPETIPSMLSPLTAYRWFIEYGGRYNTKWKNRVTQVEPDVPVRFNAVLSIPYIQCSLLMMIAT
jgi:alpha-beta hydrolase superfamily lysophospholipase